MINLVSAIKKNVTQPLNLSFSQPLNNSQPLRNNAVNNKNLEKDMFVKTSK